jgi:hypothetical protein
MGDNLSFSVLDEAPEQLASRDEARPIWSDWSASQGPAQTTPSLEMSSGARYTLHLFPRGNILRFKS